MYDIWNVDNDDCVVNQYNQSNYKIVETSNNNGYCVIYCSSNDIWYPNEKYTFMQKVVKEDRYEWTGITCRLAKKEIYIRDIYKSWYVIGINSKCNSIDKLLELLRIEIGEMPVVCIGSSAGGYLAALLACLLHAEYGIVFSAQFELNNKWALDRNPFLKKFELDKSRNKYYDLKSYLLKSTSPIYYICPIKSESDYYQLRHIREIECIKPLIFNSKHHGVVVFKNNLSTLISMTQGELELVYRSYMNTNICPFSFSVKLVGLYNTVIGLYHIFRKKLGHVSKHPYVSE